MLEIISTFSDLESPRIRDIERRFLQSFGWTAYEAFDRNGGQVWLWSNTRYKRSYYRGQAFAREFARQAR